MKYLGLDIGEKKVGVSISDQMGIIAREYGTYSVEDFKNILTDIVKKEEIEKIVIGRPRNSSGDLGPQYLKTVSFVNESLSAFKELICWEDETLTSKKAEEELKIKGFDSYQIKERVDSVAAKIILQGFLDQNDKFKS
jgi:putative holliday junction resolvase